MPQKLKFLPAVQSFLKYLLAEKGYSELTIVEYERDLQLLHRYLVEVMKYDPASLTVDEIGRFEVSEFLNDMVLVNNNAPITRNRRLYSLRSFFRYMVKMNILEANPAEYVDASKTEIRAEPIYMRLDEAKLYISTVENSAGQYLERDLAIIKMFLYGGLRVSEVVDLNLDDLDFADQSVKFFGKGAKERYVPLHPDVIEAIYDYLPHRANIRPKDADGDAALFRSKQGTRFGVRSIQLMVKKYAKLAGIRGAEKITPD